MSKEQLLIVDDEEVNRAILNMMFNSDYEILEASNGEQAIEQIEKSENLCLILLDVIMPVMDGFGVLEYMEKNELIDKIPVILITSMTPQESEEKAYTYRVADVMRKPFEPNIVKRRAKNIIELYQSKKNMELRLKEQEQQILKQEKKIRDSNEFMIDALSSVVEFRSVETGDHIKRIKYFTRIIAKYMAKYFPKYGLTQTHIDQIARAAALHDIGKIGIPDAILLKPGRLTPEEFEIMKTHTTIGCGILESFKNTYTDEFYQYCYDICRYHHERWDGNGYPDRLVGDEIPISAQIVSIADVYDALVSDRVYKSAYSNSIAYEMILNGECGQFAPDVIECFELAREDFFNIVEVIKMFDFT
ncbi:MAG: response regulator [Lachnospiraceae bacterium]